MTCCISRNIIIDSTSIIQNDKYSQKFFMGPVCIDSLGSSINTFGGFAFLFAFLPSFPP